LNDPSFGQFFCLIGKNGKEDKSAKKKVRVLQSGKVRKRLLKGEKILEAKNWIN
jgi:hypothetical protein